MAGILLVQTISNQTESKPTVPNDQPPEKFDCWGVDFPFTLNLRIKFFITGVILPGCCIYSGIQGDGPTAHLSGNWQSGEFSSYVQLFMSGWSLAYSLPFFLFSMAGLIAILIRHDNRSFLWVRAAIYSGVVLATINLILLMSPTLWFSPAAALVAGPTLAAAVWLLSKSGKIVPKRFGIRYLMILTLLIAVMVRFINLYWLFETAQIYSIICLVTLFIAGTTLNWITYCRVAFAIFNDGQKQENPIPKNIWKLLSTAIVWFAAYGFMIRSAIERTLLEYENLPTQSPDCYVCSAAAHGHPWWVGTKRVVTPGGVVRLNRQMQRLKMLELSLTVMCPRIHRLTRFVYDFIGPILAKMCAANRWIADAAFIMLKPVEWLASLLAFSLGIRQSSVCSIYQKIEQENMDEKISNTP